MDRETELALVGRLRGGDAGAFDAVYDEYRARLYNFLARLSRSRDVAEDLAEETWLRLVASSGRLRPDTRLGPWLFTVARNLYYSYCRSRALGETVFDGLIGLWPGGARGRLRSKRPRCGSSSGASSRVSPPSRRHTAKRCCWWASKG